MSVSTHLQIPVEQYDARIRTFVLGYEEMVEAAAGVLAGVDSEFPHIVDLGAGTGALAAKCLTVRPGARLTLVDADAHILALARQRFDRARNRPTFVHASFLDYALSSCDAIVASLSLHHVRTREAKLQLYRACRAAVSARGLFVTADCCPAVDPAVARLQRAEWRAHLQRTYSGVETDAFFAAWAEEDVYFTLADELAMFAEAGLVPEVVWRSGPMAVIAGRPQAA